MPLGGIGSPGFPVYLEVGHKRVFAGAVEWPGWCRSGATQEAALSALVAYAPRYQDAIQAARLGFVPVADAADLTIVETLEGNSATDFGAPGAAPSADSRSIDDAALRRLHAILASVWRVFDDAVEAAHGRELRKGPRGGGRDLDTIVEHVIEADQAYLARVSRKPVLDRRDSAQVRLAATRQAVREALDAAARGLVPERGPRGGKMWTGRYFARRLTWHVLDHAWEVEDRTS